MHSDDEVVGHKTFYDEHGELSHKPLTQGEADRIMADIKERDIKRRKLMPDEQSAIDMMFEAYLRLKELGWNDAIYAPKNGKTYNCIEMGSTGIHQGYTEESGRRWTIDHGDLWPSHHVLFKLVVA